jgi:hypothetical protein
MIKMLFIYSIKKRVQYWSYAGKRTIFRISHCRIYNKLKKLSQMKSLYKLDQHAQLGIRKYNYFKQVCNCCNTLIVCTN